MISDFISDPEVERESLEVLQAVAAHGSFSTAATELDYTQSAVSQHIAMLEHETGMTLIERAARAVTLTDAGALLLEDATPALEHLLRAEHRLRDLAELRAGHVRLGAFPSAHAALVPIALAAFKRAHPQIDVALEEAEPTAMLSMLRSGALDLADEPWIAAKPPNDFRELFDRLCQTAGFEPQIAIETGDPGVGVALAHAGIGAVLATALILKAARPVVAVPVTDIPSGRALSVATLAGRRHAAVTALSDALVHATRTSHPA